MSINTCPSALLYPSMVFSTFDSDCDQLVKIIISQRDWKEILRICGVIKFERDLLKSKEDGVPQSSGI